MFAADVAEESRRTPPVCSHVAKERFAVVNFRISTTAPAVGLSRVPQKTTKTTLHIIWYRMLVSCCTNPTKQKKTPRVVLVPARTAVKLLLGYGTGKIKSNPLQPHFENSATMSRSLDGTKTAVALAHCSESTKASIAGWCIFGSEMWLALWQHDGMSYKKNTQVEVLPVVDLCTKSTK